MNCTHKCQSDEVSLKTELSITYGSRIKVLFWRTSTKRNSERIDLWRIILPTSPIRWTTVNCQLARRMSCVEMESGCERRIWRKKKGFCCIVEEVEGRGGELHCGLGSKFWIRNIGHHWNNILNINIRHIILKIQKNIHHVGTLKKYVIQATIQSNVQGKMSFMSYYLDVHHNFVSNSSFVSTIYWFV